MKILIIEDEPAIRENLQFLLEMHEHTVIAAADGPEGVRLAAQQPDLILCDVGLPGLDGYGVITTIQELPACRDIPFIFLTAHADRQDQRRGMALGADDYITKPFTQRDIIDAINARVRRLQPLRERVGALLSERRTQIGARWSHELMTPLTGILGGLQMIEAEADTIKPAELRELLALIRMGASRQLVLSRKLVCYFELEELKVAPRETSRTDAPAGIEAGVAHAVKTGGRARDITTCCEAGTMPVAKPHLLAAVTELVDNALRFSVAGQPIMVTGSAQATGYRIEVLDQGVGMTPEQCDHIGPFVQFDRDKREQQGLGLGLAIVQSVAKIAGGSLRLAPGPGSRGLLATLDLPGASIPCSRM